MDITKTIAHHAKDLIIQDGKLPEDLHRHGRLDLMKKEDENVLEFEDGSFLIVGCGDEEFYEVCAPGHFDNHSA